MAISAAVNAAAAVPPASSHSAPQARLHENTPVALVMAAAGTVVTGSAGPGSGRAGLDGSCEGARYWQVNRNSGYFDVLVTWPGGLRARRQWR